MQPDLVTNVIDVYKRQVLYSIRRQEAEKKRIQKMRQSNTVKEG